MTKPTMALAELAEKGPTRTQHGDNAYSLCNRLFPGVS